MWAKACDLIDEAERLQRRFFRLNTSARTKAGWEPPVDMFENERELVIVVAMPGVPRERIEVVDEPGALTVRGERPLPGQLRNARILRMEIPHGHFERSIDLPPVPLELSGRHLANGCLMLQLRRR